MRTTSLLRALLGVASTRVSGYEIEDGTLLLHVRPTWRFPRCSGCRRVWAGQTLLATEGRRWRHLDLAGVVVFLCYDVRQVACRHCGRVVEHVPWAPDPRARFTEDFDEQVAYLAQACDKTAVQHTMGISWRSVGRCVERVVTRLRPQDPLANLTQIGIDELSYRKYQHYLTLVSDLVEGRIVWGKAGRDAATLKAFFDELGPERCDRIEAACIDMSAAYTKAIREAIPQAELVYDRFHVQRLVGDALDETRREEWRRLRGTPDADAMKHTRWALLKNPVSLTEAEAAKLAGIQRENKRLYRGYLLKEQFRDILDQHDPKIVGALLHRWHAWAVRSRLPSFAKAARTIARHLTPILAYVRLRVTNAIPEGLNTKARLLTRRSYGFHSSEAALAMIMLCCSGLDLRPVRKLVA